MLWYAALTQWTLTVENLTNRRIDLRYIAWQYIIVVVNSLQVVGIWFNEIRASTDVVACVVTVKGETVSICQPPLGAVVVTVKQIIKLYAQRYVALRHGTQRV